MGHGAGKNDLNILHMKRLFFLMASACSLVGLMTQQTQAQTQQQSAAQQAQQPQMPAQPGQPFPAISVHDPVIIRQDSTYYIFCTGKGISMFSSTDMKNWVTEKPVFDKAPEWTGKAVAGFTDRFWAPDISYHNGQYYLFYAISAFGKNTSCIGVATNKTLHTSSPDYKLVDHGKVIESVPGRDMWNAIDPNEVDDENGNHWLDFGSFWNGIKMVKLDN